MSKRSGRRTRRASAVALLALGLSASGTGLAMRGDERSTEIESTVPAFRPTPAPSPSGIQDVWPSREPVAVAVRNGVATFDVPAPADGAGELLVVVSSLAREPGPFSVRLSTRPVERAEAVERAEVGGIRRPASAFRAPGDAGPVPAPSAFPEPHRDFHILAREGDVGAASNYEKLPATLQAVGERVQVYVADEDAGRVDAATLADVVETFDLHVRPVASRTIGLAGDVDGDGRFTVFFSGRLARLGGGKNAVDGFVRVADLDPAYPPPFGNRCDMMYLSTTLRAGPHLRTVLAHEYTHAVVFTRKCLGRGGGVEAVEEEGWLDEGLAHLCEDLHGFGRSNLDHRVSAFLSRPECYRLVVEDYYAADLFRSHGNRGGAYLFLRWCADQYGPDLLPTLVGSPLRGEANLEAAVGRRFEDLFRDWSFALYVDGAGGGPFASAGSTLGSDVGPWLLAGPRPSRAKVGQADSWESAGTSPHYTVVDLNGEKAVRVVVEAAASARLQVTAALLPRTANLALTARTYTTADGRLMLRASAAVRNAGDSPLQLTALAWEPLTPTADPRLSTLQPGRLDADALAAVFGTAAVPPAGKVDSGPIPLDGLDDLSGPLVVKLLAHDPDGRPVTAWATLHGDSHAPVTRRDDLAEPLRR